MNVIATNLVYTLELILWTLPTYGLLQSYGNLPQASDHPISFHFPIQKINVTIIL